MKWRSKYTGILLLFLIFCFHGTIISQTLPFRNYSEHEGLPDFFVSCVYQDSEGYIWFGTSNGLSRFDGIDFKNFNEKDGLTGNFIRAIMEDGRGNIWIGTERGGINCSLPNSPDRFYSFSDSRNLETGFVMCIAVDEGGSCWFGTEKGLIRFDGDTLKTFTTEDGLPSNYIRALTVDKKGGLWLGTKGGVCHLENGRFSSITTADGLLSDYVFTLYPDSNERLWIGTNKGLDYLKKGKIHSYTIDDGLCHNNVTSVMEDETGNIWIGTWNGISCFTGTTFKNYDRDNGLPYHFIQSILNDREGNLWVATNRGVGCLSSLNITNYTVGDGLTSNKITSILQDKRGRYWFGTGNGLNYLTNDTFNSYTTADGLIGNSVNGLLEDSDGKIWVSTVEGLSIFSPKAGTFRNYTEKDGLAAKVLFNSIQSRDGTIWIGSLKGVTRYRDGVFSCPLAKDIPSPVMTIVEDANGGIWLSSINGVFNYSSGTLKHYTTEDGLVGNAIISLFVDSRGTIWIGTPQGLSRFTGSMLKNYTMADGLPNNKCYFIQEDNSGNIWISTAAGLACFDGKQFKTYTAENRGFVTNIWLSGYKDRRGDLWLGSAFGVTRIHLPFKLNTVPPPIVIQKVKILEKDFPISKIDRLEYQQNHLRIGFAGLCFSAPESVVYKYRLTGIADEWTETRDRSLFYPYLPPGNYRFQVKAVNNDGIESIAPAELLFQILPPFWKTWWFYSLLVIVTLALVLTVLFWRFKRAKEKYILESRTRQLVMSQRMELMGMLAGSAVHDLKNLLSIIIGYSEIVADAFKPGDENSQYNENIKKTANTAVQVVKQILSFARIKHDSTDAVDLKASITEILETLKSTSPTEIAIHWDLPLGEIPFNINPTRFQQLIMNLCINAVQAMPLGGELKVSLKKEEGKQISISVTDTGTGIDKQTLEKIFDPLFTTKEPGEGTGLGLFVVKQIVDEYNGKINVQSQPGKGTTFLITFVCDELK